MFRPPWTGFRRPYAADALGCVKFAALGNPVSRRIILSLLLWASAGAAVRAASLAETRLFATLGTAQGLPSSTVYETALARRGFLWIATSDGLARYDGVSFKSYRPDPRDPDALPASSVQTLFVDREDRLWLGIEDA